MLNVTDCRSDYGLDYCFCAFGIVSVSIRLLKCWNLEGSLHLAEMLVVFRVGSGLDDLRVVVCGLRVDAVLEPPHGSVLQSRDSSLDPRHRRPPRVACRRMARNRDCAPEPHDLEQALHWPKEPHSQSAATRFKFRWRGPFERSPLFLTASRPRCGRPARPPRGGGRSLIRPWPLRRLLLRTEDGSVNVVCNLDMINHCRNQLTF